VEVLAKPLQVHPILSLKARDFPLKGGDLPKDIVFHYFTDCGDGLPVAPEACNETDTIEK